MCLHNNAQVMLEETNVPFKELRSQNFWKEKGFGQNSSLP